MVFYATEVFHLATYFVSAVNVQRSSSRTRFTIPSYLEKTNQKFAIPAIWLKKDETDRGYNQITTKIDFGPT
jgi:hypothetical protein